MNKISSAIRSALRHVPCDRHADMRAIAAGYAATGIAYGRAIDRALNRTPKPVRARWSQYTRRYLARGGEVTIGTFLAIGPSRLRGAAKRWGSYRVALERSCDRLVDLGLAERCHSQRGCPAYRWATGCEDRGLAVLRGEAVTFMPRVC